MYLLVPADAENDVAVLVGACWMLKRKHMQIWLYLALCLTVVACSGSSSNPGDGNPGGDLGGDTSGLDPAIAPFIQDSVAIRLSNSTTYQDLRNIALDFTPDLVGDPRLRLSLTRSNGTQLNGNLRFSFEDQVGFWGAVMGSYGNTGTLNGGVIDTIFADDELVVRVQVFPTTETCSATSIKNGQISYRVRETSEDQCKPIYYCANSEDPTTCTTLYDNNGCRNYMNPAASSKVKALGDFCLANFSLWVK